VTATEIVEGGGKRGEKPYREGAAAETKARGKKASLSTTFKRRVSEERQRGPRLAKKGQRGGGKKRL